MKKALALALGVSLTASALPSTAQEQTEPTRSFALWDQALPDTAGPLASAVRREARQLAAAGASMAPGFQAIRPGGTPVNVDWARVRRVPPGTEIAVTLKGSPPGQRYFVAGDESGLTVLNVTDPALPRAARNVLRELASRHSEALMATDSRSAFGNGDVRVGRNGVFVADRKIAELGQVVERIARTEVAEIQDVAETKALRRSKERHSDWRTELGMITGLVGGGLAGGNIGSRQGGGPASDPLGGGLRGMLYGGIGGTVLGGVLGHQWSRAAAASKPSDVIYRAP